MSDLEEKLGAVLGNPAMMQQIMALAQTLQSQDPSPPPPPAQEAPAFDPRLLQSLAGIASQGTVDKNQQSLLNALSPYLSQTRVHKLERAMRAARIAGVATNFLNTGGLQLLTGR